MNRLFCILLLFLYFATLFSNGGIFLKNNKVGHDTFDITPHGLFFNNKGGSQIVIVSSYNDDYAITNIPEWLKIETTKLYFKVYCNPNNRYNRSCVLKLKTRSNKTLFFKIKQQGDYDSSVISNSNNEQLPLFPGGETALVDFIYKNMKYPEAAYKAKIQGHVVLSFEVDENGCINNINVISSPSVELSSEAIRIVLLMPKWTPGKIGENNVNTKYVLPITFSLQ